MIDLGGFVRLEAQGYHNRDVYIYIKRTTNKKKSVKGKRNLKNYTLLKKERERERETRLV